jgi:hypothetical protein
LTGQWRRLALGAPACVCVVGILLTNPADVEMGSMGSIGHGTHAGRPHGIILSKQHDGLTVASCLVHFQHHFVNMLSTCRVSVVQKYCKGNRGGVVGTELTGGASSATL